MSYISGNLGEDSRILIYDTVQNILVVDELVSAGSFNFSPMSAADKHVIAISEVTGEAKCFGNVTPAGTPYILEDYFGGTALDTSKWDTFISEPAHVAQDDVLELHYDGGSHGGSHVISKLGLDRDSHVKVLAKWKAGTNHYSNKGYQYPYVAFHGTNVTRGSYGEPTNYNVSLRLGVQGNTNTRTGVAVQQNSSAAAVATYPISINMLDWHDIIVEYDGINDSLTFTLNDSQIFTRSMSSNDNWVGFEIAFGMTQYSGATVEYFDDIRVEQL